MSQRMGVSRRPSFAVLLIGAVVLSAVSVVAARATQGDGPRRAVLATVQKFFDSMANADERTAAEVLVEDGQFYSVREGPDGATLRRESHRDYLASIATGERRMRERIWDANVMIHDRLAVVWAPYDFHLNGRFSHCGVDAFNLVRTAEGWKIAGVTYTVQTTGCATYSGVSGSLPTGSYSISSEALVASYDMVSRTADGQLRDFSGNANHGTVVRADDTDGRSGRARRFSSVADRVALASSPGFDLDGPLTVAAWLRVDRLGLHQHVFACDNKWALWITPDNQFRLGDTQGGGWSGPVDSAVEGRWTSVVVVLSGTKGDRLAAESAQLYVDGELVSGRAYLRTAGAEASGVWSPAELFATDACYIGFESHQGNEGHQEMPFVGAIDELLLFARAWTADEARAFADR